MLLTALLIITDMWYLSKVKGKLGALTDGQTISDRMRQPVQSHRGGYQSYSNVGRWGMGKQPKYSLDFAIKRPS